MRSIGVDIRVVGLFTLAQAPWAFKVLWSPLMDRYVPPFWGRRRGWMAVTQIALAVLGVLLAGVGRHPDAIWVVGAIALAVAFASATQDVAIDAYAVEVLRKEEQGAAAGARTALYRAALVVSGGAAITAAARIGWPAVNVILGLLYLPMLFLTLEGAGAGGARRRHRGRCATPSGTRSWASSRATARSRSSRSSSSTSSRTSSPRRSRGRS